MVGVADHHVNNGRNTTCFLGTSNVLVGSTNQHIPYERNTLCFLGESLDGIPRETLGTRKVIMSTHLMNRQS